MSWVGAITNAGNSLLAQWTAGTVLTITSAKAGTGYVQTQQMRTQTALVTEKQTMSIVMGESIPSGRRLKTQVGAAQAAYTLNQIGIFASLDGGSPVLLALYQNTDGVSIPDIASSPEFLYTFFATLNVANTGTLNITIDTSAVVSQSTMEAYVTAQRQKVVTMALAAASWTGASSPYSQTIVISGSTADSKIDPQPDATVLGQMAEDGTESIYVINNNNVLTAYAVGNKPTVDLNIQATKYEVGV